MSTYTIKKGNHYASGLHLGVHFGITEQKYRVRFSKECLYTPDWENDWNKLCGWSYGLHHNNSIRVCWRPQVKGNQLTDKIELCIYVYENGVRKTSTNLMIVEVEQEYPLSIKYDTFSGYITAKTLVTGVGEYSSLLKYSAKPSWGYRLYPYIGGDNVATVDTNIEVTKL